MWRRTFILLTLCLLALPAAAESFSLKDTSGKTHTLADYKGKWVLVNFWATWCPPCLEEIPDLIMLNDKRKDVTVIGVAMDYKDKKEITKFADDNLMSYPIVLGDDAVTKQFGTTDVLPTTFIFNPQGKLIRLHRGLLTRQFVEKLISEKSR